MSGAEPVDLDIVIPVFNQGANIAKVLDALTERVATPFRVLICYDFDEDDTLPVVACYPAPPGRVVPVRNRGQGALAAVVTGLAASTADAVLIMPADDDYNAPRIDALVHAIRQGCDVVCASRFMPGARVSGFPWVKGALVRTASFLLHRCGRLPVVDATNGFRMFSRRAIKQIPIESKKGHAYSLELLAKCHRLGWRIGEVAADWSDRNEQKSRFRILEWMPTYLRWFGYVFATTYLRRRPNTVVLRPPSS